MAVFRPAPLPQCPRCGMSTKVEDWSAREVCCRGCEKAQAEAWTEPENEMPWLPEEDEK